jgi:uncharacterized protein
MVTVLIKLTPKSRKNAITGVLDDGTIKISVTAAPVDNKANEALIKLLSKSLSIKKHQIQIKSGLTSRLKTIELEGVTEDAIRKLI